MAGGTDEYQSGVLAAALCLDGRHQRAVCNLVCPVGVFLAAENQRRRAFVGAVSYQRQATRPITVLRAGYGYGPGAAVTTYFAAADPIEPAIVRMKTADAMATVCEKRSMALLVRVKGAMRRV